MSIVDAIEQTCQRTQASRVGASVTLAAARHEGARGLVAEDWDGAEAIVSVRFEPQALGPVRDTLIVSSATGGEYRCTLLGVCKRPQPQGPFVIAKNGSREITFRNVFGDAREFSFTVDNAAFAVSTATHRLSSFLHPWGCSPSGGCSHRGPS